MSEEKNQRQRAEEWCEVCRTIGGHSPDCTVVEKPDPIRYAPGYRPAPPAPDVFERVAREWYGREPMNSELSDLLRERFGPCVEALEESERLGITAGMSGAMNALSRIGRVCGGALSRLRATRSWREAEPTSPTG